MTLFKPQTNQEEKKSLHALFIYIYMRAQFCFLFITSNQTVKKSQNSNHKKFNIDRFIFSLV